MAKWTHFLAVLGEMLHAESCPISNKNVFMIRACPLNFDIWLCSVHSVDCLFILRYFIL